MVNRFHDGWEYDEDDARDCEMCHGLPACPTHAPVAWAGYEAWLDAECRRSRMQRAISLAWALAEGRTIYRDQDYEGGPVRLSLHPPVDPFSPDLF